MNWLDALTVGPDFRFSDEEDVFRVDPIAAKRAGGMSVEPRVNAFHVEGVLAFWEESKNLGRFEPGQAHGAFKAVFLAPQGSESENG